jgi:chromosome segregation ATPase
MIVVEGEKLRQNSLNRELAKINKIILKLSKSDVEKAGEIKKLKKNLKLLASKIKEFKKEAAVIKDYADEIKKSVEKSLKDNYEITRKDVSEYIEKHKELIDERLDDIKEEIEEFNKKIIGATELVSENIHEFDKKIDEKLIEFNDAKLDKVSFENTVSSINNQIKELTELLDNTRKEMLSLFEVFNNKVELINEELSRKLERDINLMEEKFGANILDLEDKLKGFEKEVKEEFRIAKEDLEKKLSSLSDEFSAKLNENANNFNAILNLIENKRQGSYSEISDKISSLEKNLSENLFLIRNEYGKKIEEYQKEVNEKIEDIKRHLNEKLISFQTEIDNISHDYDEIINLNKSFTTLINSFDKRLEEFNEKLNSKIIETREAFDEKIKNNSEYLLKLYDDMNGFLEEKLSVLDSKIKSIEIEKDKLQMDEKKISDIEDKLNTLVEDIVEVYSKLSETDDRVTKIKEDVNEKIGITIARFDSLSNDLSRRINENVENKIKVLSDEIHKKIELLQNQQNQNSSQVQYVQDEYFKKMDDIEKQIKNIESNFEESKKRIKEDVKLEVESNFEKLSANIEDIKKEFLDKNQEITNKIYSVEKSLTENISLLKSEYEQKLKEHQKEIDEKMLSFQNNINKFAEGYEEISDLSVLFTSFAKTFDKRLNELADRIDSKLIETKQAFEDNIRFVESSLEQKDTRIKEELFSAMESKFDNFSRNIDIIKNEFLNKNQEIATKLAFLNKKVSEEIARIEGNYQEFTNNLKSIEEKIKDYVLEENKTQEINEKISKMLSDISSLERDIMRIGKSYSNLRNEINKNVEDAVNSVKAQVDGKLNLIEERINSEMNARDGDLRTLSQTVKLLDDKILQLSNNYSNLQILSAQIKDINASLTNFESRLKEIKTYADSLKASLEASVDEKIKELRDSDISRNEEVKTFFEAKLQGLNQELLEMQKAIIESNSKVDSLAKDLEMKILAVKNNYDNLQKTSEEVAKSLDDLTLEINRIRDGVKQDYAEKIEELAKLILLKEAKVYEKINEVSSSYTPIISALGNRINSLNESLTSIKAAFDKRLNELKVENDKKFKEQSIVLKNLEAINLSEFKEKVDAIEKSFKQLEDMSKKIETISEKIKNIEEKYPEMSAIESMKDKLKSIELSVSSLNEKLLEMEKKINFLDRNKLALAEKQLKELTDLREMITTSLNEAKREIDSLKKEINERKSTTAEEELILKALEGLK